VPPRTAVAAPEACHLELKVAVNGKPKTAPKIKVREFTGVSP